MLNSINTPPRYIKQDPENFQCCLEKWATSGSCHRIQDSGKQAAIRMEVKTL